MQFGSLGLGAALSLLAFALGCATPPSPPSHRIEFNARFGTDDDGRRPGWLGYAMARIAGAPGSTAATPSPDPAPFEEEFYARESLAQIWGELAQEHQYYDPYLADLVQVNIASFMREYTWLCILDSRGQTPPDLRLTEFRAWLSSTLPEHRVESWAPARLEGSEVVLYVGSRGHRPYSCAGR